MERTKPVVVVQTFDVVVTAEELLLRHACYRALEHCWRWTGLDHPKLVAAWLDKYVKACTSGERERSSAVCVDHIGSQRSAGMDDRAINADRGERADQRTISIEIDPFYDGFWLRNTADDVPPVRGE